jgi:hypothetical protein
MVTDSKEGWDNDVVYCGNSDAKSAWIRQLVTRIGVNKACVAVANKMARVAWALLHTGEQYRKPVALPV